ncbi:MAG: hypothetical protein HFF12_01335 [Angelakisella sp.]|nr:hypothetical protein [Angelakisella sp.]
MFEAEAPINGLLSANWVWQYHRAFSGGCQGAAGEWTNTPFMPIWAAAHPRLLFLLAKDQEIPKGISNETGQREAMPAREAGVFKMKEFHFERVLEKEAKRRMTIRFQ